MNWTQSGESISRPYLKNEIKSHLNDQKKRDLKYNNYIKLKPKISKFIYDLKKFIQQNNDILTKEFSEIKNLDKELRKNSSQKELVKIKEELINVYKNISSKKI